MTIRKLTSIILTMVMLVSISVISASAADFDAVIAENETIQVSASFDKTATIKFVSAESKTLALKSENLEEYGFCDLYDENEEFLESSYENLVDTDFTLVYDFEAGKTYYFDICVFSDEELTFSISLVCAHEYTDGVCDNCGVACDHNTDGNILMMCDCGAVYNGSDIACGDTDTVEPEADKKFSVFRFIPEETGNYIFRSLSDEADPIAYLFYDSEFYAGNDDFGDSYNFVVFAELTEGETYYFITEEFNDMSYDVMLTKAVHTADDGSEHDVEYHDWYYGTCQEITYTEGIYCPECDEYIEGHLEDGYGYHEDWDYDGMCDYCGESLQGESLIDIIFDFLDEFLAALQGIFDFIIELLDTVGVW